MGRVYVTSFLDDCSNYRVVSGAYLYRSADEAIDALKHALAEGRIPREIYLDNGKQFRAEDFKEELRKYHIKWIYGKPSNPKGGERSKATKVLQREPVTRIWFKLLLHFKGELKKFDKRWNGWRKQHGLGWKNPASIYNDKKHINKRRRRARILLQL